MVHIYVLNDYKFTLIFFIIKENDYSTIIFLVRLSFPIVTV